RGPTGTGSGNPECQRQTSPRVGDGCGGSGSRSTAGEINRKSLLTAKLRKEEPQRMLRGGNDFLCALLVLPSRTLRLRAFAAEPSRKLKSKLEGQGTTAFTAAVLLLSCPVESTAVAE